MYAILLLGINIFTWNPGDTIHLTQSGGRDMLLKQNLDISIAKNYLKANESELTGARLIPNPNLALSSTFIQFKDRKFDFSGSQQTIHVDKVFELGGKRGNRIDVAEHNINSYKADYSNSVFQTINDFKSSFISFAFARKQYELSESNVKLFQDLVDIERKRLESGDIGRLDLDQLELALFSYEQSLIDDKQNLIDQESKIHNLLNIPENVVILPEYSFLVSMNNVEVDSLLKIAFKNRSDYLSQIERTYSKQSNIELARSNGWPDLDVGVELDYLGPDFKTEFGVGLGISIPIFNRNQDAIERSLIEYKASELELEQKKKLVEYDVEAAYDKYQKIYEYVSKISSTQLEKNEEVRQITEQNYKSGNISTIDLINNQQLYVSAIKSYYDLLLKFELNKLLIEKAVGKEIF